MTKEKDEFYNKILEAMEYTDKLFILLDDTVYGNNVKNPDMYDGMCKTERIMISNVCYAAFQLYSVLKNYNQLIDYNKEL